FSTIGSIIIYLSLAVADVDIFTRFTSSIYQTVDPPTSIVLYLNIADGITCSTKVIGINMWHTMGRAPDDHLIRHIFCRKYFDRKYTRYSYKQPYKKICYSFHNVVLILLCI